MFALPSLVDLLQVSKPPRSGRLKVISEIFTQLISEEEVREGGKLTKKVLCRLKIKIAFVVLQDISSFLKLLEHLEIDCLQSHTRARQHGLNLWEIKGLSVRCEDEQRRFPSNPLLQKQQNARVHVQHCIL